MEVRRFPTECGTVSSAIGTRTVPNSAKTKCVERVCPTEVDTLLSAHY